MQIYYPEARALEARVGDLGAAGRGPEPSAVAWRWPMAFAALSGVFAALSGVVCRLSVSWAVGGVETV